MNKINAAFGLIFACFLILAFGNALPQGVGLGTRMDMTTKLGLSTGQFAQIFIPDYFSTPPDERFVLVFHLHSASWAAENEVYKAGANAVLFNIHLGAFSSPYQNYFADQNKFQAILNLILSEITSNNIMVQPTIDKLIITSFSAGYAGVREIIKRSDYYEQINALALADGLHSNSEQSVMAEQMKDFLHFTEDARDKNKIMCLTHSQILTSGYESTTSTADYLITGIGSQRISTYFSDEIGLQLSACDTGYFHLKGYSGQTAGDHLQHLYGMNLMLEKIIGLLNEDVVGVNESSPVPENFINIINYPNPFNSNTTFFFSLPGSDFVQLVLFNCVGEKVDTIYSGFADNGKNKINWDAVGLSSGIYFYRLFSDNFCGFGKCLLLR